MELAIWQKWYLMIQNVARLLLFRAAFSRVCNVAFATSAAWHPQRVWSIHCSTLNSWDRFEYSTLIFYILLCVNALCPPNHSIPSVQYRCMQFGTHFWSCDKNIRNLEWPAHSLRPAVSIYKGSSRNTAMLDTTPLLFLFVWDTFFTFLAFASGGTDGWCIPCADDVIVAL